MAAMTRAFRERLVLALIGLGGVPAVLGTAGLALLGPGTLRYAAGAAGAGVVLLSLSAMASRRIDLLHTVGPQEAAGSEYAERRYWGRLKSSSILLNLLVLVSTIALIASVFVVLDLLPSPSPESLGIRIATLLGVAILLTQAYAHYHSLRVPLERPPSLAVSVTFALGTVGGVLSGALLLGLALRSPLDLGYATVDFGHAPYLALLAATLTGLTLFVARSLPTIYILFTEEREFYHGRGYLSRGKNIYLPALSAFALLFIVIFILLLLGLGTAGIQRPVHVAVLGFIAVAMTVSIYFSVRLARSEDREILQRERAKPQRTATVAVLLLSIGSAAAFFGFAGALVAGVPIRGISADRWVDAVCLGLLAGIGPYAFDVARRLRRTRKLEERFPDFLRDIASSHKGGLTLPAAIGVAANGEYGELTPEIRKMADQLAWNTPFQKVLDLFAERVRTPLVGRAVTIIKEANRMGGNTADVILAAARDVRDIKNLETQRRQTMGLYTIIIYLTFVVFLGVAATLYSQLVPQIVRSAEATQTLGPGFALEAPTLAEYRAFYFIASLVQSLGNGLVAGIVQSGRAIAGLRHSFLMVLLTYVAFGFLLV